MLGGLDLMVIPVGKLNFGSSSPIMCYQDYLCFLADSLSIREALRLSLTKKWLNEA